MSPQRIGRLAFVLVLLALPAVSSPGEDDEDLSAITRQAEARLRKDLEAWSTLAFRRQVNRRFLDADDVVRREEDYDFWITPIAKGFDERLRRIGGRAPTAEEIAQHRRAGRFAKHYKIAAAGRFRNPVGEDIPLALLIHGPRHRRAGEETIGGVPCLRLDFDAQPEPRGDATTKLVAAMEGSLWLTLDGYHLARYEGRVVRPVKKLGAGIERMEMLYEAAAFDGLWLPTRFETRSHVDASIAGHLRRHNTYRYSEYRRP